MEWVGSLNKFETSLTAHVSSEDALDFDRKCDQSLPLEELLSEDAKVRKLLEDMDRSKTRVWALTNAYVTVRFNL